MARAIIVRLGVEQVTGKLESKHWLSKCDDDLEGLLSGHHVLRWNGLRKATQGLSKIRAAGERPWCKSRMPGSEYAENPSRNLITKDRGLLLPGTGS
jgi:hypothetical protein